MPSRPTLRPWALRPLAGLAPALALLLAAGPVAAQSLPAGPAQAAPPATAPAPTAAPKGKPPAAKAAPAGQVEAIVAVVNGDAITRADVENREKLFALSAGLPLNKDVLDHLAPQVTQSLIDERLRLQEEQRRKIVVADQDIADAIASIEQRNNMPQGTLRERLAAQGVSPRTLIDQIRTQLGWNRVLREELGAKGQISDADIAARIAQIKGQAGQNEYHIGEIFISATDPAHQDQAQHFADTVITQLRQGAPFPVVAAQFSQSENALEGGEQGWVRPNQVDPAVAQVLEVMPVGAISNPIPVAGGFMIVQMRGKRQIGNDMQTIVTVRQAFFPFEKQLDPANPTPQQRAALEHARQVSASVKTCDQMEQANKDAGAARPADPGELRLDQLGNPALRSLLAALPVGKASAPLVASDGIAVVIICARDDKNVGEPSKQDVQNELLSERVELASRQLLGDLRRRASIQLRSS